jgi:hypothetical protein
MENTENTNIDNNEETKETTENKETKETETKEEKLFTQDDIEKIISKRLDRERKKAEEEKAEAERLAKLSESQRQKELLEKEKAKLEEERKVIQKQKLEMQITKELATKSLPVEFSSYLIGEDAESSLENIKVFETKWTNALEKAVQERLKSTGYTPPIGDNNNNTTKTTGNGFVDIIKENQARR